MVKGSDAMSLLEWAERAQQTREVAERFVNAWFAGDEQALTGLIAVNATWRPPASITTPVEGRPLIAAGLCGGAAGRYVRLETLKRTLVGMLVDDNRAALMVHLEAETLRGEAYVNEYTWILEFNEGVVARIFEYADTLCAARLGFVPFREDGSDS